MGTRAGESSGGWGDPGEQQGRQQLLLPITSREMQTPKPLHEPELFLKALNPSPKPFYVAGTPPPPPPPQA